MSTRFMGPRLGWGLLALAFYLLALLSTLPAQRVAAWAGLPLTETQGSIWRGSATLAIAGERIENLRWHLQPAWPWQGAISASLQAEHQKLQAQATVTLGWNGALQVRNATLEGPLDSPLLARRIPIPVHGELHGSIDQAVWHRGLVRAQGVALTIRNAQVQLGAPIALGDLGAMVQIRDGVLEGKLHDHGGPLELVGSLKGNAGAGVTVEARLKARPDAPAALGENLRLLPGQPDGSARVQTRLPAPWLATAPKT